MKKRKKGSLSIRLFSTIFIVIVLLNLLSIIGALSLSRSSRDNMIQEHRYLQQSYIDQLDRELEQAQIRMYDLSRSRLFFQTFSDDQEGADEYEKLRHQVELNNEINEWLGTFPLIDGYYIYDPDSETLIICGNDSGVILGISDSIKNMTPDHAMNEGWTFSEKDGIQNMLQFSSLYQGVIYGSWVQTERLLEKWGLLYGENYAVIKNTGEEVPGVVDVVSSQADVVLRYEFNPGTSFIPTGVIILLIASVVMLVALPAVWLVLRHLVIKPLQELIDAIRRIESGEVSYRIQESASTNEFNRLNVQFNNSLDQLASMGMQVYESRLEKERIYINYLSQQIQPHFVLNTLNLIFSMEPDEYDLIQDTVACLSDYYRYIAHIHDPLVQAEAELEHVKNYFRLQEIRYPEMFFYEITCPEKLKQASIPPLIIQTFAENSIKHSMNVGAVNRMEIVLDNDDDERIHIMIRDHGAGYPEEVLKKIRIFRETGEHQEGLGIGIQNTIERIWLIYQDKGDIKLSNAPDGGAMIDIYLPI